MMARNDPRWVFLWSWLVLIAFWVALIVILAACGKQSQQQCDLQHSHYDSVLNQWECDG